MAKELYEDANEKELEEMEEIEDVQVGEHAFTIAESGCPTCSRKMKKFVEEKSLFDGFLTFHINKFRFDGCKKKT